MNTNFLVFGMTRSGLEPTIYRTRGMHANHYTTDDGILFDSLFNLSKIDNWYIYFTIEVMKIYCYFLFNYNV